MPRFVLADQVWEVTRDGSTLAITETVPKKKKPKETTRKFVTADAATAMLLKLVDERERAGWTRVELPPPEPVVELDVPTTYPRSHELEAAIAATPYDPGPYLVYADWLQGQGDPRGELIVRMQHGPLEDVHAFMKLHRKTLCEPLIGRVCPSPEQPPMIWKHGFIHRVELDGERTQKPIADKLDAILQHASGALVTELELCSDDYADLRRALEIVARAAPPSARVLEIASAAPIGELTDVLRALPRLTRLAVKMRTRRRTAQGLAPEAARAIAAHAPPTLERLELRLGDGGATVEDLAPLFARTDLTRLTHLRVRDCADAEEVAGAILDAPFAGQLVVLDFAMCRLSDAMARRLLGEKARLPALDELWISSTHVSKPAFDIFALIPRRLVDPPPEPVDVRLRAIDRARYANTWE